MNPWLTKQIVEIRVEELHRHAERGRLGMADSLAATGLEAGKGTWLLLRTGSRRRTCPGRQSGGWLRKFATLDDGRTAQLLGRTSFEEPIAESSRPGTTVLPRTGGSRTTPRPSSGRGHSSECGPASVLHQRHVGWVLRSSCNPSGPRFASSRRRKPESGRCPSLWPCDVRNDGVSVAAGRCEA